MKILKLDRKIISFLLGLTPILGCATSIPMLVASTLVVSQPAQAAEYAIYGGIFDKWASMGGERSALGKPTSNEQPAARGGRYNSFQYGYIYWRSGSGAYAVYGDISRKWNQMGRENSGLGYPVTDEYAANGGGRMNRFDGGYIVWHPSIGAYAVYGDISSSWVQLGGTSGRLGYPISDEMPEGNAGQRVQRFQKGSLYWNSGSRKITVAYN